LLSVKKTVNGITVNIRKATKKVNFFFCPQSAFHAELSTCLVELNTLRGKCPGSKETLLNENAGLYKARTGRNHATLLLLGYHCVTDQFHLSRIPSKTLTKDQTDNDKYAQTEQTPSAI